MLREGPAAPSALLELFLSIGPKICSCQNAKGERISLKNNLVRMAIDVFRDFPPIQAVSRL